MESPDPKKIAQSVVPEYIEQAKELMFEKYRGTKSIAAQRIHEFRAMNVMADFVNLASAAWIGFQSFFSQKKKQEKQAKAQRHWENVNQSIDKILNQIIQTGLILARQKGVDPTTADFERLLYENLFEAVGYRGNCNATVWKPGSKPGSGRPVWFTISGNGSKLTSHDLTNLPPNLQQKWYVHCKNAKDLWVKAYREFLIEQGRLQELEDFDQAHGKSVWTLRIGFGLVASILVGIAVFNARRIK